MSLTRSCVLIAALVALLFRLPSLELRPMHTDEAVNAYKLGELLDQGDYQYDPKEYHGPTLSYLSRVAAQLADSGSYLELRESTLRLVPVLFGWLLIVLLFLLGRGLGLTSVAFAAVFTAVSPAMVFYSRYFIHEMLLVTFTFTTIACGYRYAKGPNLLWAGAIGLFLGLMIATKETSVIAIASMVGAVTVVACLPGNRTAAFWRRLPIADKRHCLLVVGTAGLVSVLLYTSFFAHPNGFMDYVTSYGGYLNRAAGDNFHDHPWHYYLGLLSYYQYGDGPVYTEALIIALALLGAGIAWTGKGLSGIDYNLLRIIALYSAFMTLAYSLIPYKTPWCLLGFHHGLILMAGVGAAFLVQQKAKRFKIIAGGLILAGIMHLSWQAYTGSARHYADRRNPYVYGHTSNDIFQIVERVKEMIAVDEAGNSSVQVICPEYDYWPLPWYLRGYPVEYYNTVDIEIKPAPIILVQPELEPELMHQLYEVPPPGEREMYMHLFYKNGALEPMELRPQVALSGFVKKQLLDRYERAR